jgi:hypothetical protein
MHSRSLRPLLFAASVVATFALTSSLHAQSKRKSPTSKFFVADLNGEAQVDTGDRIDDLEKKSVYNAQGTIIQTKEKSNYAMVYSNGTGIYFDPSTRVHVKRFEQEPFKPNRSDMETEPSISQTQAMVDTGTVGLCTSKLVAGSTMNYQTPLGTLNMRGRKAVIEVKDDTTTFSMVEGDSSIRSGELDLGGHTVHEGEQAIIKKGANGAPNEVTIQKIPKAQVQAINDKVTQACLARKTVYFETGVKQADGSFKTAFDAESSDTEIVAVPVVPGSTPTQFTISAANLSQ